MGLDVLELLKCYAALEEVEDRLEYAVAHLPLLSSIELRHLADQFEEAGDDDSPLFKKLVELDVLRKMFADRPERFPIGSGPIEQIADRVVGSEISLPAAIEEVCAEGFGDNLAPVYAHVIRMWAMENASDADFSRPVIMIRLLTESCVAFGTTDRLDSATDFAIRGFLDVATRVLVQRPYGALFQRAVEFGELAVERALQGNQRDELFVFLHSLGSLHADPWTVGRNIAIYDVEQNLWLRALEGEMGPPRFAQYQEHYPLPSPAEAFDTAISYYERALEYSEGEYKGDTLKAILQCLDTKSRALDIEVDATRITELCHAAIELLPRGNYNRNTVLSIAAAWNIELEGQPFDQNVDAGHLGPLGVLQEYGGLIETDPGEALRRLLEADFEELGSEHIRRARLLSLVQVIPRAYGIDVKNLNAARPRRTAKGLVKSAAKNDWSSEYLAVALFAVAQLTTSTDEEAVGLELLAEAEAASEEFVHSYGEAIRFLRSMLSSGAAVNALNEGDLASAIELYGASLGGLLDLQLPVAATEVVKRVGDLAGRGGDGIAAATIDALAPEVLRIETDLGEGGAEVLQQAIARLFRNLAVGGANEREFASAIQMGKSAWFCSELRSDVSLDWRADPHAMAIVEELEGYGPPDIEYRPDIDESLLVSYSSIPTLTDGRTREEKLENAQIRLDAYLSHEDPDVAQSFVPISPEALRAALSPNTVFLDYFFADVDALQRGVYIVLATNDSWAVYCNPVYEKLQDPDARDLVGDGSGVTALRRPLAEKVSSFREALQLDPDWGMMHCTARGQTRPHFEMLLGWALWDRLAELRDQGRDHLCISPHGALRYYPMSLLGDGERILADDWTVTTVPALDLLFPTARPERPTAISVLGLSYETEAELAELPGAIEEARSIADQYGTSPILNDDATERAALKALLESSRVHISAHGAHDVATPLFQCLLLAPDAESDGRLYAYELLGLDLSGIEIMTLGACETALGRFDVGDNTRGLPAALFLAGVSTIVAGLWDVSDDAARTFFSEFHKTLHAGNPPLDAFRSAQRECRASYPEARDWAAFQFIGRYQ